VVLPGGATSATPEVAAVARPEGLGAQATGDVGARQVEVVVPHDDRSLFDRQPPEGPLQLIAVVDRVDIVCARSGQRPGIERRARLPSA
jgi:hypothetical protein